MFGPVPPTCTVLHCVQEGNSYTGFADGRIGYDSLPDDIREFAEGSDACYRPSIIYGNPELGIASLGSRVNQNKASGRDVEAQERVEAPALNTLAGDAPHPDDPVYRHALVQPHPWTGEKCLRFSIKGEFFFGECSTKRRARRVFVCDLSVGVWTCAALETVGDLAPKDGVRKGMHTSNPHHILLLRGVLRDCCRPYSVADHACSDRGWECVHAQVAVIRISYLFTGSTESMCTILLVLADLLLEQRVKLGQGRRHDGLGSAPDAPRASAV